jgi:hypothetical protein
MDAAYPDRPFVWSFCPIFAGAGRVGQPGQRTDDRTEFQHWLTPAPRGSPATGNDATYPEMSMFGKVMPAFGACLRHVNGVTCDHVTLSVTRPDARPAVDLVDVEGVQARDFLLGATVAATTSEGR